MRMSAGDRGDAAFQLGWAIDAAWPGLNPIANTFGAAPTSTPSYARGNSGQTVHANVGGTVSVERLDGRAVAQLGIGAVNEQVILFPASPRLAKPPANRYVNPETMMFWWEFSSKFQAPGASELALWHGIRNCTSASTHQWSLNNPAAVGGEGIGVGFDGAGNLRVYTKRLDAVGAAVSLGGVALPAGLTPTDWLRWSYVIIAATPTRAARIRIYLENALVLERAFDDDGTGTTNSLPDYEVASGNTSNFCLSFQARSDQVAGIQLAVGDVRFRMGRYDVNGAELVRT